MGIISCISCKSEISSDAKVCPKCGHPLKTTCFEKNLKLFWYILAIGGVLALLSLGGGIGTNVSRDLKSINEKVVSDTLKQYEIAKMQGDKMQICVQAGLVAAAYLQAQNATQYNVWKEIEKGTCQKAGLKY